MDREIFYLFVWLWIAILLFIIFIRFFPKKIVEKLMHNYYFWWILWLIMLWNYRWRSTPIGGPTFGERIISWDIISVILLTFVIIGIIGIAIFWWMLRKTKINIEKTKALFEENQKK